MKKALQTIIKFCSKCKEFKKFYKGKDYWCIDCTIAAVKARQKKKDDEQKKYKKFMFFDFKW